MNKKLLAIIWDFDGTIANTAVKNYTVTKKIVEKIKNNNPLNYPALKSLESYIESQKTTKNWRTFYRDAFNLLEDQVDTAGILWTELQLEEKTIVPTINGVTNLIIEFSHVPQAIISQNSRENIITILKQNQIEKYFKHVIGYEEVDIKRQKPHADAFILGVENLLANYEGNVIYIGDHETDVQFVENAREQLSQKYPKLNLVSIAYNDLFHIKSWNSKPDYFNNNYSNIQEYISSNFVL